MSGSSYAAVAQDDVQASADLLDSELDDFGSEVEETSANSAGAASWLPHATGPALLWTLLLRAAAVAGVVALVALVGPAVAARYQWTAEPSLVPTEIAPPLCAAPSTASPPPPPPPHPSAWSTFLGSHSAFCTSADVNFVLNRETEFNLSRPEVQSALWRPWTLLPNTFLSSDALPPCSSVDALLQALRLGQRHPLNTTWPPSTSPSDSTPPPAAREKDGEWLQSFFVPSGCSLDYQGADGFCSTLQSFSHVLLIGDSLTRHMTQGLFMALTEDPVHGAIPRLSARQDLYDACTCDGQFSEAAVCRSYTHEHMMWMPDLRQYGVCPHTRAPPTSFRYWEVGGQQLQAEELKGGSVMGSWCSEDSRPRLLFLQTGVHHKNNFSRIVEAFLDPILSTAEQLRSTCAHPSPWSVVWAGSSVQGRVLDQVYPHQAREVTRDLDERLSSYLLERFQVPTLPLWNLTAGAATSDGFHYLSEANLLKAVALLHFMSLTTHQAPVG